MDEYLEIITENMIFKFECEDALREEFEANLEKEPSWTCCP